MDQPSLIEKFKNEGYIVVKNAIPLDVINNAQKFLSDKIDEYLRAADSADSNDYKAVAASISNNFLTFDDKTKHLLSGHFDLDTRLDPRLYAIFEPAEELQALLCKLLDTDILYLHMPTAARWIMPSNEKAAVPTHQDISYNKHMSNFVVCWVPFVDINEECGGVFVYDNTGHLGEIPVEKGEFWLNEVNTGALQGEHKMIQRGDVLMFNPYVLHKSVPNISDHVRISCDFRFFGDKETSTKSYLDLSNNKIKIIP